MKVTLLTVASIDGKTTKHNEANIYTWTSKEDRKYFFKEIDKASAIIMGRTTYQTAQKLMKHKPGRTRIIMTRSPEKYKQEEIKDQLEFTNKSPYEIVTQLEERGHREIMLVGGESTSTLFLKERLITNISLTIEPTIFTSGRSIFKPLKVDVNLQLASIKKLNPQGTILLKYKVI